MTTNDGNLTCAHEGCDCRVADTQNQPRDSDGALYCSDACQEGRGCDCSGCDCCGSKSE